MGPGAVEEVEEGEVGYAGEDWLAMCNPMAVSRDSALAELVKNE